MQNLDLNGHHQTTLEGIFRHPIERNLEWHDASSLLGRLGTITERKSGEFEVRIGARHLMLTRPSTKDLDVEDVRRLQVFLRDGGFDPTADAAAGSPEQDDEGAELDCVVLIDHELARLFLLRGENPSKRPTLLTPSDRQGFHRHIQHRGNGNQNGRRGSEDVDFLRTRCR